MRFRLSEELSRERSNSHFLAGELRLKRLRIGVEQQSQNLRPLGVCRTAKHLLAAHGSVMMIAELRHQQPKDLLRFAAARSHSARFA